MKRIIQAISLVAVLMTTLGPANAGAAGSANISGWAEGRITYYANPRTVTNPSSPGPEVAFYTYTAPPGLYLGPNNCYGSNIDVMRPQEPSQWSSVAYFYTSTVFCISSASPHHSGSFSGLLDWD